MRFSAIFPRTGQWGRAVAGILALLTVMLPLAACGQTNVVTVSTAKGETRFSVEIADTQASRQQGLMFRDKLAPDKGMLFDFQTERQVSFWMQNTLIPLDMIFIGADGMVRNVHAMARPMDTTPIPSDGPVRYVLEIAGGRAAEIGVKAGDRITGPPMNYSP